MPLGFKSQWSIYDTNVVLVYRRARVVEELVKEVSRLEEDEQKILLTPEKFRWQSAGAAVLPHSTLTRSSRPPSFCILSPHPNSIHWFLFRWEKMSKCQLSGVPKLDWLVSPFAWYKKEDVEGWKKRRWGRLSPSLFGLFKARLFLDNIRFLLRGKSEALVDWGLSPYPHWLWYAACYPRYLHVYHCRKMIPVL